MNLPHRLVDPSPDEARDWVERELARPEYPHPSLLDRFWAWITERWELITGQAIGSGVGTVMAIAVGLVVALVLLAALTRVRRDRSTPATAPGVLDLAVAAATLRERAEQAAAAGRHDDAVADAARALARRCVERGLLADAPGRTAHEVFGDVGARFPGQRVALAGAADLFDRVVYGGREATAADAALVLDLEDDVRRAAPVAPQRGTGGLVSPR